MASEKTILNLIWFVIIIIIGISIGSGIGDLHKRLFVPCEEFKATAIKDLPTRCIYLLNQSK